MVGAPTHGTGEVGGAYLYGLSSPMFVRADCTGDGGVFLDDIVFFLQHLFLGTQDPPCQAACDSDDDGELGIGDAMYVLSYMFLSGPPPPSPFPGCGCQLDAELPCAASPGC